MHPEVALIAALGKNRELGKNNKLLWRIPEDLKHFKTLSLGHPVIMGRKTFESIGKPLPGRTTIVVTRDTSWSASGTVVLHTLTDALAHAEALDTERVVIAGGAEIYTQALPYATALYLTLIDDAKEADSFFPPYETEFTKIVSEEKHVTPEGVSYRFVHLTRGIT
jgi:dihydrofolate reductase